MPKINYNELPVDQHMLIGLSAPRPVYIASAAEDLWADPKGEFLSGVHATEIYNLFGSNGLESEVMPEVDENIAGDISYHIHSGKHDILLSDWKHFIDFSDRFFTENIRKV